MKSFNKFAVCAAALTLGGLAQSQADTIRITGSTAYRAQAYTAIQNIYDAGYQYAYDAATLGKSGHAIFIGTIGGTAYTIKTSWTGSEAGIQTVSASIPTQTGFAADGSTVSVGGTSGALTLSDTSVPDVAFSDTYQTTSAFNGLYKGTNYPALTESSNSPCGVVAFKWVASKSVIAGVDNVTDQLAQTLFANGKMSAALFTGTAAGETTTVYALGRDPDSGTRLSQLACTGLGALATVKHYQPRASGTTTELDSAGGAIATAVLWPASTVNGIAFSTGNGGYNSGGNVANALQNTSAALNGFFVSWLGVSDADNAITGGCTELAYNGVTLGKPENYTLIYEGKYAAWGYEHVLYRAGAVGTSVQTVADLIAGNLKTTSAAVLLGNMRCSRANDGAKIVQFGY